MLGIGALKDAALKPSFNFKHKTQYKSLKTKKKLFSLLNNPNTAALSFTFNITYGGLAINRY